MSLLIAGSSTEVRGRFPIIMKGRIKGAIGVEARHGKVLVDAILAHPATTIFPLGWRAIAFSSSPAQPRYRDLTITVEGPIQRTVRVVNAPAPDHRYSHLPRFLCFLQQGSCYLAGG